MVKGFVFFKEGKIPFVIEDYRMELFTDDSLMGDFCKEYNYKGDYILHYGEVTFTFAMNCVVSSALLCENLGSTNVKPGLLSH